MKLSILKPATTLSHTFPILLLIITSLVSLSSCKEKDPDPVYISSFRVLDDELAREPYGFGAGFRKDDIALGLEIQRLLEEMIADSTAIKISLD